MLIEDFYDILLFVHTHPHSNRVIFGNYSANSNENQFMLA
jgi:hypothetical protein